MALPATPGKILTRPARLVLDTNVWLDWFIFDDPAVAALKGAHRDGSVELIIDEACLQEFDRVLVYPEFALTGSQRSAFLAEVGRRSTRHESSVAAKVHALPRCNDPDDQKFLELARDARADWLLTRDKALLRLARKRLIVLAGFRIATPEQWAASVTGIEFAASAT
jgi:putative PIN family toxin of toxin-antitoxin system